MLGLHIIALAFALTIAAGFYLYWTIGLAMLLLQAPFWWMYIWSTVDSVIYFLENRSGK